LYGIFVIYKLADVKTTVFGTQLKNGRRKCHETSSLYRHDRLDDADGDIADAREKDQKANSQCVDIPYTFSN